jgi:hypothetical protein
MDGGAGIGRFFILPLQDDGRIVPGASSKAAFDQQMMQLDQC